MSVTTPIYMDYNATTPVDPRVLDTMMPYLMNVFGNAASKTHSFGREARQAVEKAREQIATLIGAAGEEVVFTSGATESDNLAIKGVVELYREKGNHIVTCETEHKAVLDTCKKLEKSGIDVTYLKPDATGRVSAEQVAEAITDQTILITLMTANNEIGTRHPVAAIGKLAKERGIVFHSDATQSVGKEPLDVEALGIDLLSVSGHKLYGPKGVGALYARKHSPRVRVAAQIHGGGHEKGYRSGTLNVPGIVGLGAAAEICRNDMAEEMPRIRALRDRLERGLCDAIDFVYLNGHATERLANTLNVSFDFIEGESLMMKTHDIAVSAGSACTSEQLQSSYVLKALGVPDVRAHGSIRFSLGRFTTEEEVDYAVSRYVPAVAELRELSPLYDMAKMGMDVSTVVPTK
jgi:cysteine desulfurase